MNYFVKVLGLMAGFVGDCAIGAILAACGAGIVLLIDGHNPAYMLLDVRLGIGIVTISIFWGLFNLIRTETIYDGVAWIWRRFKHAAKGA